MVRVCDAIMGTGKSSAAITYINEHPEKKYIYITPYVAEARRIAESCGSVEMYEPMKTSEFHGSKTAHTLSLVEQGKSIATTHQAFRLYSKELTDKIKEVGYTLIIDEDVDTLSEIEEDPADVRMAIDAQYLIEKEDAKDVFRIGKDVYNGKKHEELFRIARVRDIIRQDFGCDGSKGESFFFWQLSPDLITSFRDVFVLTYLFEGQSLYCMFKINHIDFQYIGIGKREDGVFYFSETERYIPEYVRDIKNKIHIIDNDKMNRIGDKEHSLSMNWFAKPASDVEQLKNNLYNFFRHLTDSGPEEKMWSTYERARNSLKGRGYTNGFVSFNKKAENKYGCRTVCAYCVNLYMNVGHKLYYRRNGLDLDEDQYALSIMVQWVWRSAIRNGKDIVLYIPSRRMRKLFREWMDRVVDESESYWNAAALRVR